MKFFIFIFSLLLTISLLTYSLEPQTLLYEEYKNKNDTQKIELLFSTTKIPSTVSAIGLDVNIHFPLEKNILNETNNFQYATMEIYSMNIFHKDHHPEIMLRIVFNGPTNLSFSNNIKNFFEKYLNVSFNSWKEFNENEDKEICYYGDLNRKELIDQIQDFYNRSKKFIYSTIFSLTYLENMYKRYGSTGNFGYLHYYYLNKTGYMEGNIEFSYSTIENYKNGYHTYDILKILNLTSIPPGEIVIEGNAMQTYTHTDFYFKSIKTNVPYTIENTTYYNITKAFEVHINANTNITQLVISFNTKENYNQDDFLTDYGGYIICLSVLLVPVAIVTILLKSRRKEVIKNGK